MRFEDRHEAGSLLGARVALLDLHDPLVVGLPRGGVPVADEVARAIGAPLDVVVVRKLGVPYQPELAMGAIGEDGVLVVNPEVIRLAHISEAELESVAAKEREQLEARLRKLRGHRRSQSVRERDVVVVDDGIATGATVTAAVDVLRARGARRIVVAVPVAAPESIDAIRHLADEVVVLLEPAHFVAVGAWYRSFPMVTDREVVALLDAGAAAADAPGDPPGADDCPDGGCRRTAVAIAEDVDIPAGSRVLRGRLDLPASCHGVVLFAHGSGSSRHSPRNRAVARALNATGLGTLLFDLLDEDEAIDRRSVFDVALLADRLRTATDHLRARPDTASLPLAYFGASTGAAAALWAAADPASPIQAVVSRGGRPDLAVEKLAAVEAPTLLIVGERDELVWDLNRRAARHLRCEHQLIVVPGATHLFEERGAMTEVVHLARDWFDRHLHAVAR
jgi:putative phosphoribosyl transferase